MNHLGRVTLLHNALLFIQAMFAANEELEEDYVLASASQTKPFRMLNYYNYTVYVFLFYLCSFHSLIACQ